MRYLAIGEICELLNGFAFKSGEYVSEGIRVIRIANVQKGYIEDSSPCYYPEDQRSDFEKFMLRKNDLLVSLTGNVGRVGLLPEDMMPAALNQRVACLRIKDKYEVNKKYLFHLLNSNYFENACVESSNGAAQKNLSTNWLKEFCVPVATSDEQKDIARIFDSIIELIYLKKNHLEKLDELVKSRFVETLDKHGKSKVPLGSLVKVMHIGPFGSALKNDAFVPQSKAACVVYEQKHAISKSIDCNWRYVDEAKRTELKRFEAGPGTILVSCRGTLGKVYRLPDTAPIGIIHPSLMKIEIDDSRVDGVYFVSLLERLFAEEAARAKGSGVKMAIKAKELSRIEVKTPSLKVQREYATFVTQVDKLKFDLGICLFILKEGIFRLSG